MIEGIVITAGRFNPPTLGHGKLIERVYSLSLQKQWDHCVYVSTVHDNEKNPLPIYFKLYYLRQIFSNVQFAELSNFLSIMKDLASKYKHIAVVAGEDRIEDYTRILKTYNGKDFTFENWATINVPRDYMSSTKMRDAAYNNDYDTFQKMCAKATFAPEIFRSVRDGLKIFC